MSEYAPKRIDDIEKAHAMALESNKERSDAARSRGIGKLILEEIERGTDKRGRGPEERIANRTQDVEEHVFRTGKYMTLSEDMNPTELQKAGLHGSDPSAGSKQFQRFYDARAAVNGSGGDAEKAVENIANWAAHLDSEANKKEDAVAAEYYSKNK